ncbi:MAG: trehalose-phosphatase, partial [Thermoleophilia bacterium]
MDADVLLARVAERPGETALILDVDGTLAPIVLRPEEAAVPGETRRELRRLVGRYAL